VKHYTALHFRTALALDELALAIDLKDCNFDAENEDEWVIGVCDGIDKIDICRTHLVAPAETETTVLRFAHGFDSTIPKVVLCNIAQRLIASGATCITVSGFDTWGSGFLQAPAIEELGL
jgi:hypothetical protein